MRRGQGDPEFPALPDEHFLAYLHRYAQHLGWLPAGEPLPSERFTVRDKRSSLERLDAIFGRQREPGEE